MRLRSKLAALTVTAGIAIAATGAYAYWTTTGSGVGSGAAEGGNHPVVVTQVSEISGMYPGGTAQAIDFKINNPGPSKQYIANVAVSIASLKYSGGAAAPGCTASDFDLVQPTVVPGDLVVGETTFNASGGSLAMKNLSTNQDACKNVIVNLAFNAS